MFLEDLNSRNRMSAFLNKLVYRSFMLLPETHATPLVNKVKFFFVYRMLRTIHKGYLYDLILCNLDNSSKSVVKIIKLCF